MWILELLTTSKIGQTINSGVFMKGATPQQSCQQMCCRSIRGLLPLTTLFTVKMEKANGCKQAAYKVRVLEQVQGGRGEEAQALCMWHFHFV